MPTALLSRKERIHDGNLTGFCIILALFSASLAMMPIVSSKLVNFGPLVVPSSVFLWALTYPASDIVSEVYGKRYAYRLVLGGFIAYAFMYVVLEGAIRMEPADFWHKQEAFEDILGTNQRIAIAGVTSYAVTQFLDVSLFAWIRRKTGRRWLWIRNNCSTFLSQTLANTIFVFGAFYGVLEWDNLMELYTNNLAMRYVLVFSDTAIVYAAVWALYKIYPELREE